MNKFIQLIIREFKLLSKNHVVLAIFFGAPILYAVLLGSVYRDAKITELPVIVADLDNSPLSHKFIDALDDNQYIAVKKIIQHSNQDVEKQLIKEDYHAIITIPERFEADIQQKRHPEIDVDVDAANMLTANYASTGIYSVLATLNAGIEIATLNKKGMPQSIASEQYESFKVSINRHYNPSSNYLYFFMPGMLGAVLQQVFLIALALSFAQEFENGTFSNLLQQSKSSSYLILVKSIPYWLTGALLWIPLFYISSSAFNIPMADNQLVYWLVTAVFFVSVSSLGIAVSVMLPSQLKATEVLMVISVPSFILSGQTWPLHQMPDWVQHVAACIPLTHYLSAVRELIMYKADFADVIPQLIGLSIITLISLLAAFVALKWQIKKTPEYELC